MTGSIDYQWLGWPEASPTLDLSHEEFAYAGKFRLPYTGKAIACNESAQIVGAIAFDEDRGVADALRIRYITVRESSRGQRIGPKLAALVVSRAPTGGYDQVRVAVNNPIAFEAMYRAGLGYTGEHRELGEVLLESGRGLTDRDYRAGLETFEEYSLPAHHQQILDRGRDRGRPDQISPPQSTQR